MSDKQAMNAEQFEALVDVINEVGRERERQHAKWGEQNFPICDEVKKREALQKVDDMKALVDKAAEENSLTFDMIFEEEHLESLSADTLEDQLTEWIQVAAVAVQIVERIDRMIKEAQNDKKENPGR
jgi:hypothetical protein